jgi:PAS domain-containing protein
MLSTSYHSHPYSTHQNQNNVPTFLTASGRVAVESFSAPQDCAIIATDELGNIKHCNAEAQQIFHCLPFYAQDTKLNEIVKIVPRNHARYAPTLWELAHSTHRPLAFPEFDVILPCEGKCQQDICSVWLHEEREGHSCIAFFFSAPVAMKRHRSAANNFTLPDVVQSGSDVEEGIIVLKKHTIIETSRTLDMMLGYKERELIGRDISCLLSDAAATTVMYAAKKHNTQIFQGLAVRRNDFLESVGFRCFPFANVRSDVVVVRLYGHLL